MSAATAAPRQRGELPPWLTIALVLPLILLLGWAFFLPIARLLARSFLEPAPGLANYAHLFSEPLYPRIMFRTLWIAALATFIALCLGYPVAALMAGAKGTFARIVTLCVMVPLWTSVLVRSYAWIILLERNGIINNALKDVDVISAPLRLLYTEGAVLMAMAHVLLPFMILPIYSSLTAIPPDLPKAAANLGAGRLRTFLTVTWPLTLPGVYAGSLIVFVMALGFYITPALVGGPRMLMIATLISQQAIDLLNWPFAGAISLVLLATSLGVTFAFKRLLRLDRVVAYD